MWNPDLLPRSKVVTFFAECAGQTNASVGPPPVTAAPITQSGGDITLIIHLAHYYDWTPQLEDSSSSKISGIPSGSSVASLEQSCPVYGAFSWVLGVLDGQSAGRQGWPCLWDSCHQPQFHAPRDDDREDDGRGPASHDWRRNINARGQPCDDLPHASDNGTRQRTRSPRGGRRNGGTEDVQQDGRGRQLSHSPVHYRRRHP
jgi:hypothetical protein